MEWSSFLPRWLRIPLTVFGLANVAAALLAPSDLVLPGVVIGLVWAMVGIKGGLPLVPVAGRSASPTRANMLTGLRRIRRRRLLAFVIPLLWLPFAATILPSIPESILGTVFFVTALPFATPVLLFAMTACPRCGRHFFANARTGLITSLKLRCRNCGLRPEDA